MLGKQIVHIVYSNLNDTYDIMCGNNCLYFSDEPVNIESWLLSNNFEQDPDDFLMWVKE